MYSTVQSIKVCLFDSALTGDGELYRGGDRGRGGDLAEVAPCVREAGVVDSKLPPQPPVAVCNQPGATRKRVSVLFQRNGNVIQFNF